MKKFVLLILTLSLTTFIFSEDIENTIEEKNTETDVIGNTTNHDDESKIRLEKSPQKKTGITNYIRNNQSNNLQGAMTNNQANDMPLMRFSGYFRTMARDDFGSNANKLGWWPAYGRLLNETPWLTMQMENEVIRPKYKNDPFAIITIRIEGGSFRATDFGVGNLKNYRITQLNLYAENYLLPKSTLQVGTIWYNMGYIGIYDFYISQIFWETAGVRFGQKLSNWEYFVGFGDSGYDIYFDRRSNEATASKVKYNSIPTTGALIKANLAKTGLTKKFISPIFANLWLGSGFQFHYEKENQGNLAAPLQTPNISYRDVLTKKTLENYLTQNPGREDFFPYAKATSAAYFKWTFWMGFNLNSKLGPIQLLWNNLSISLVKKRPDVSVTESYNNVTKDIYISEFTDERYELYVVNESIWTLISGRLDMVWGVLYSHAWDNDNTYTPTDANRQIFGSLMRFQYYFTKNIHALFETSLTTEKSLNGNKYREHFDSMEANTGGTPDINGLEYGDTDTKNTLQVKFGPVLNLNGKGINNRPSIRLLFGWQYSNVHAAFGNSFESDLSQRNVFTKREDAHVHYMVSIEAEHWWGSY